MPEGKVLQLQIHQIWTEAERQISIHRDMENNRKNSQMLQPNKEISEMSTGYCKFQIDIVFTIVHERVCIDLPNVKVQKIRLI